MKIILEFSEEEVRELIAKAVTQEASKHGHRDSVATKIHYFQGEKELIQLQPLASLKMGVVAEINTNK